MKSRNHLGRLGVAVLAVAAASTVGQGETPAELGVGVYAGLTITGNVGTVYSIEYVTDLSDADAGQWRSLEFLQLPASNHLWFDRSAPATARRFYRAVEFSPPGDMVFIPPGTFRMGSPVEEQSRTGNDGPQTAVIISRGFWMGRYEVTQEEYETLMGNNPSYFTGDPRRPVDQVSWNDATNYRGRLTDLDRASGRIPPNAVYRLPTEAEWEYACRAWTSTRFSYGDDPSYTNLANYAWYRDNSQETTQPVGLKLPNPWGLHDMHGNVSELCLDWYAIRHPGGVVVDPQGPIFGDQRVCRGGNYAVPGDSARSAVRSRGAPYTRWRSIGFRVVLAPGDP